MIKVNQRRSCLLNVLIFLLLVEVFPQRGGGGRRFRSRSYSRLYRNGKKSQKIYFLQNIQIVCGCLQICLVGRYFFYQKIKLYFKKRSLMKQNIQKCKDYHSSLNQQQKSQFLNILRRSTRLKMFVNILNLEQNFMCHLQSIEITQNDNNTYKIKFKGNDLWGLSEFQGICAFKDDGIEFKVFKRYKDQQKAGQTNQWDILYYQGAGKLGNIKGQWAFLGFQNQQKYSGTWFLINLEQINALPMNVENNFREALCDNDF